MRRSEKLKVANICIFVILGLVYLVVINSVSDYSGLYFFQLFTAKIVFFIQSILGIDVLLQGTILNYPEFFRLKITGLCTGINELLFFSMIVMSFIGVSLRTKLKGFALFFPIIIFENLVRISFIYPLAVFFGNDFALGFHDISFKYGQMIFITVLIVIWFKNFGRSEFMRSLKKDRKKSNS